MCEVRGKGNWREPESDDNARVGDRTEFGDSLRRGSEMLGSFGAHLLRCS